MPVSITSQLTYDNYIDRQLSCVYFPCISESRLQQVVEQASKFLRAYKITTQVWTHCGVHIYIKMHLYKYLYNVKRCY